MKKLTALFVIVALSALAQTNFTPLPPVVTTTTVNTIWQTNTVTVTNVVKVEVPTVTTNPPAPPIFSGPLWQALQFASTGTNWIIAGYGIEAPDTKEWGGGVTLAYKLSDYLMPTLGVDYLGRHFWMPSGQLQLQAPLTLFGKVTTVPFLRGGIATPISGGGSANGTPVGIAGAGIALRLDFLGSGSFWQHSGLVYDEEIWTGLPETHQRRFGFYHDF